jgi:small subunit ribosomal protein S19
MPRSLKKGPYISPALLKRVARAKANGTTTIPKSWERSSTILPDMVGLTIGVHNGKDFIMVLITEEMVGQKLGEFSYTTKFKQHGGKAAK